MNHSILVELARALTTDDFVARLPDPVLIVRTKRSSMWRTRTEAAPVDR